MEALQLPVFITCRDRVTPLRALVEWLETAGHEQIVLVDNASTYPELLDFLRETSHRVEHLEQNLGSQAAWRSGLVEQIAGSGSYIVTDPDVLPDENCPVDCASVLLEALRNYPNYVKAGLGLRIDDIPVHYLLRDRVIRHEQRFWDRRIKGQLYSAPVDTTFAMYRPGPWPGISPALRTGAPYVARHLPWYADSASYSEEDSYYVRHANGDNSWTAVQTLDDSQSHESQRMGLVERLRWRLGMWLRYGFR